MGAREWRIYGRLVGLLPPRFRERFGGDMQDVFAYRLGRAKGPAGRAWVWMWAVIDVVALAARERWGALGIHENRNGRGGMGQDLGYAVRALRRAPLLAVAAVATLALGIGASTATFSVVGTVLLKELPYRDADRLVAVWPETNFNNAMLVEVLAAAPALESASGLSGWSLTLVGEGEPLELNASRVWADHFRVLGVAPLLGRDFTPEEQLPGRGDVVILSHGFWTRVYGADPGVLGRRIQLSGADADVRTIIGVMPPDFRPLVGDPDAWVPMGHDPALSAEADDSWFVNHRVARLAPGATVEQATEQIRAYARALRERMPRQVSERGVERASIQPLRDYVVQDMGGVLWAALGAVSLVLLIACANVANLLLARGEARARDLTVRVAMGASRARVIRMLLAESALLGLAGGALGVALASALVRAVVAWAPASFPRLGEVGVDAWMLAYAVAMTLLTVLAAGLVPALRVSRVDATSALGGATRSAAGRTGSRLTRALVGLEVALAVVVAVGSGLMMRSLHRLTTVDVGLRAEDVLVARASPPGGRYPDGLAFQAFYASVLEQVRALPDVASAGAIHLLPGTSNNWNFPTFPEGFEIPEGSPNPVTNFRVVWPGYFETVGMELRRGRLLEPSDDAGAEKVVVINEAFAERFWPGEDPLGKAVRTMSRTDEPHRVVGVVGNVRQAGLAAAPEPEMYYTHPQKGWNMSFWIMVRARPGVEATAVASAVQEAIWAVDREVPVTGLDELSTVFDRSAATARFLTLVLGSFGALALLLGAVGVFGVTTFTAGRRVPEFGVRVALGSSRAGIVRAAMAANVAPVVAGLALGLAAAWGASGVLEAQLFGVPPTDPVTYAGVALTLLAVALAASLPPALRACRVDPVEALRGE